MSLIPLQPLGGRRDATQSASRGRNAVQSLLGFQAVRVDNLEVAYSG